MASNKKVSKSKMNSKQTAKPIAKAVEPKNVAVAVPAAVAPKAAVVTAPVVVQAERTEAGRDRSTIVALVAKLRDCDAEVARDAATTLGNLPVDAAAVDALCAAVINKDGFFHSVVRASAAASLGKLGDRRAVDALLVGINDTMAEASEEAIKALGNIGDARAVPALKAVVQNERGFFLDNVRRTAQEAIEKISRR